MTAGAGEAVGEGRAARRTVSRQRDCRAGIPDWRVCSLPAPITPDSVDFRSSRRHPGFPFPSPRCCSALAPPPLRREAQAKQTRPPLGRKLKQRGRRQNTQGSFTRAAERPQLRGLSRAHVGFLSLWFRPFPGLLFWTFRERHPPPPTPPLHPRPRWPSRRPPSA